jgi:hypothetical protein
MMIGNTVCNDGSELNVCVFLVQSMQSKRYRTVNPVRLVICLTSKVNSVTLHRSPLDMIP